MKLEFHQRQLATLAPGDLVQREGKRFVFKGFPMQGLGTFERPGDELQVRDVLGAEEQVARAESPVADRLARQFIAKLPKRFGYFYNRYPESYISLGCDPEFFMQDPTGVVLPAYAYLPPKGVSREAFWDGFQAEMAPPPQSCMESLTEYIKQYFQTAYSYFPANTQIALAGEVKVPELELKKAKPEHVALGCDPSFNVYGAGGQVVQEPREMPVRWAGGHIHFGVRLCQLKDGTYDYPKFTLANYPRLVESLVRMMDLVVGVPGVLLAGAWDNTIRRRYYGLAGEFRLPAHGLEYRTLSNFWLYHRNLAHLVLGLARAAYMQALDGELKVFKVQESEVQRVINENDQVGAAKIIKANSAAYLRAFRTSYNYNDGVANKTLEFLLGCEQAGGFAQQHGMHPLLPNWKNTGYWWSTWITR